MAKKNNNSPAASENKEAIVLKNNEIRHTVEVTWTGKTEGGPSKGKTSIVRHDVAKRLEASGKVEITGEVVKTKIDEIAEVNP